MSATQALIARLLEQRDAWCDLGDGLRVKLRRPAEAELGQVAAKCREAETYLACAVGWDGFSEAALFGAAIGSADPLPFDHDLWMTAARDRGDWIGKVTEHVCNAIFSHRQAREADAKN